MENELFAYISKFMPLTDAEKLALAELALFKNYKKGTILLKEGQLSNDSYFVLKGCFRCYYMVDGEEKTTAFYTESEAFSPLCSINNQPSEHFVACIENCTLLVSNPSMEKIIFEKFPRFETLCRVLSEQIIGKQQATIDEFKKSSPEQRYLNLLEARPDLVQRVPQYQLASFLGMKPQSLSRIRKRVLEKTS